MREWIDIARHHLTEGRVEHFELAPGFEKFDYQITPSLADYKTWTAPDLSEYCYAKRGRGAIGEQQPVVYILVSKKDNTIIPIGKADTHNQGYALLWELVKNKDVTANPRDYIPISAGGNVWIYSKSDVDPLIVVAKKFLSYGGRDGMVKGFNDMRDTVMHLSDLIATGGVLDVVPNKLAPVGERVLKAYQAFQQVLVGALHNPAASNRAFLAAGKLADFILSYTGTVGGIEPDKIRGLKKEIAAHRRSGDLNGLEQLMFGFDSIKRDIHLDIRRMLEDQKNGTISAWDGEKRAVWGNLEMAEDAMGRF